TDAWQLLAGEHCQHALAADHGADRDVACVIGDDAADDRRLAPERVRAQCGERAVRLLRRHRGHQPALAGDVERIEAQHLAGAAAIESETPSGTSPTAVVEMKTWSPLPRSTTLVSPVTSCTSHSAQAARIEATIRRRSSSGSPSSRMKAAAMNWGRAPPTARSLTLPVIASFPMSPPGKKIGLTTNESVVTASRPAANGRVAWSSRGPAGAKTSLISSCVRRPPLPGPSTICRDGKSGVGHAPNPVPLIRSRLP